MFGVSGVLLHSKALFIYTRKGSAAENMRNVCMYIIPYVCMWESQCFRILPQ